MYKRRPSDDVLACAKADYASGTPLAVVADKIGCSGRQLRALFCAAGVTIRSKRGRPRKTPSVKTDIVYPSKHRTVRCAYDIAEAQYTSGLSLAKAAANIGVTPTTLSTHLKRRGVVKVRGRGRPSLAAEGPMADKRSARYKFIRAVLLGDFKFTQREIALVSGCSHQFVCHVAQDLKRAGALGAARASGSCRVNVDTETKNHTED